MNNDPTISRREFARAAALVAATATVIPAAVAQEDQAPDKTKPATPLKPPSYEKDLTPTMRAEAESKFQWVLQRYGDRLDASQRDEVRKSIYSSQKALQSIREFPLENGDAPGITLNLATYTQERR